MTANPSAASTTATVASVRATRSASWRRVRPIGVPYSSWIHALTPHAATASATAGRSTSSGGSRPCVRDSRSYAAHASGNAATSATKSNTR